MLSQVCFVMKFFSMDDTSNDTLYFMTSEVQSYGALAKY